MSFLQTSFLWGLLAASIPIIIHLLNRRRHRTVQWAAMEFLLKATRESRGKKKLKYLIILACRTLAIAALIFAMARPIVGGFLGWGNSHIDTVILILDRSSSMEQLSKGSHQTKRESAIASVRQSLLELESPRLILIDSASGTPQEVPSPDALAELTATSATDTASSIPTLISTAIDYVMNNSLGRTEIWLASDLQQSDWAPEHGQWDAIRSGINDLPESTTLRILALPSPVRDNVAIRVNSSRRQGNEIILNLEITRSNYDGQVSLPLTYSVNGTRSSDKITLTGQSYQFQKRLPIDRQTAEGYGFVAIPSDTNARDNVSYFAYGKDIPAKTYLISEGGESAKYLKLSAAPPGYNQSECVELSPSKAHKINWPDATLIIWQAKLPSGTIAQELSRYVQSGGIVLFLPPQEKSENNFFDLKWGEKSASPRGQYFIVDDWEHADGPLRDGMEGTPIPVQKLKAIQRRTIVGDATTLATWDDHTPFLVRKVQGNGTAFFVATLPDYTWSNLGDGDVSLPLIQRMLTLGDQRFGSAFSAIAGSQKAQPAPGETRTRIDSYAKTNSANAPYEAGVWKFGDRLLATNRPVSEDLWQILSSKSLDNLLTGVPYKLFEDQGQSDALAREIWKAFLIAMLVFLITEAILCLQPKKSNTSKN